MLSGEGKAIRLPTHLTKSFNTFQLQKKGFCVNDVIRITANGKSKEGKRLINGANYRIARLGRKGEVVLDNGWTIDHSFQNYNHGYVNTSHASQGKTVSKALILYSNTDNGSITSEGFYVATSRARTECTVFTTDKTGLKEAIHNSSLRLSATEIADWEQGKTDRIKKNLDRLKFINKLKDRNRNNTEKVQNSRSNGTNPKVGALQGSFKPIRKVTRNMITKTFENGGQNARQSKVQSFAL